MEIAVVNGGGAGSRVEVIAPFGGSEEMVKDLKDNVFPEREITYLTVSHQPATAKAGGKQVKTNEPQRQTIELESL